MPLVWPVLAQVLLTLVVLVMLGRARVRAARAGEVRLSAIALSTEAWPDDVRKISNNFANQFETPVLFYVLCGVAAFLKATAWPVVLLAWIYVGSRVAHVVVHTGPNAVLLRFRIFLVGAAALAGMWLAVVLTLLLP